MRTMDHGQLQLLLNAAAAIQPQHHQFHQPQLQQQQQQQQPTNPMQMLFSSMSTQPTTPSIWPNVVGAPATTSTGTSTTTNGSYDVASIQQLLFLHQAIQTQQAAALAQAQQPVITTPPVLPPSTFNLATMFPSAAASVASAPVTTPATVTTTTTTIQQPIVVTSVETSSTPTSTCTATPVLTPHPLSPSSSTAATPPDMFTIKFLQMRALEAQEAAQRKLSQARSQMSPTARAPTAPPSQPGEQQQQQQQPLEALRKISTVSMPVEFVQVPSTSSSSSSSSSSSGNSSTSQPASSPSTSSKKEEEDEEEEVEEFVDIESVDVAIDGKEKRKAHVEFYRRMKYMRQHFRDKSLTCFICKKKVENHENAISVHVAEHADAGCYQCRLCGWQAVDKYKIYGHMRSYHPRKVDMFVDRRDMPKMCNCLSQCFPKTTSRPKKESNQSADTYLTEMLKGHLIADKTCDVCKTRVRRDKAAMIRHVQTNHTIKCKTCKTITATLEEQLAHQEETHQLKEPKMSVHYAPSAAAIYLLPALEKCFPH